jgi:hypothetical protein
MISPWSKAIRSRRISSGEKNLASAASSPPVSFPPVFVAR